MADKKKQELFDLLNKNEFYSKAIEHAPDDAQRRFIKAYTEDFILNFYNGVYKKINEELEKNPDALRKAVADLSEELIKSGSISK